ncbi:MAG: hypothetical protein FJ087_07235 [Deltaproteobacteria bacterium]|nr:hypothetical protein [Deltaproteobacteria bacterium]
MSDPLIDDTGAKGPGGPDEMPPEPPKARSVLSDILARAAADTEAETRRLQDEIRVREERERAARDEEERKKREESRARVEAERQQRLQQIEEYERRKKDEEEARAAAARPASVRTADISVVPPKKSRAPMYAGIAVAVAAIAAAGTWMAIPKGEPVTFVLERSPVTAKAGAMQTAPVPFGAATVEAAHSAVSPDRVVAVTTPAKYQAAPPEPKVVAVKGPRKGPEERGPQIKIGPSIFGTKGKIVK